MKTIDHPVALSRTVCRLAKNKSGHLINLYEVHPVFHRKRGRHVYRETTHKSKWRTEERERKKAFVAFEDRTKRMNVLFPRVSGAARRRGAALRRNRRLFTHHPPPAPSDNTVTAGITDYQHWLRVRSSTLILSRLYIMDNANESWSRT